MRPPRRGDTAVPCTLETVTARQRGAGASKALLAIATLQSIRHGPSMVLLPNVSLGWQSSAA
jgi:hypothetical protein